MTRALSFHLLKLNLNVINFNFIRINLKNSKTENSAESTTNTYILICSVSLLPYQQARISDDSAVKWRNNGQCLLAHRERETEGSLYRMRCVALQRRTAPRDALRCRAAWHEAAWHRTYTTHPVWTKLESVKVVLQQKSETNSCLDEWRQQVYRWSFQIYHELLVSEECHIDLQYMHKQCHVLGTFLLTGIGTPSVPIPGLTDILPTECKRRSCRTVYCFSCEGASADRHPYRPGLGCGRDGSAGGRSRGCGATVEYWQHPHYGRHERRLQVRKWQGSWQPHSTYWPTVHLAHWRWRRHDDHQNRLCLRQVRVKSNYTPELKLAFVR